MGTNEESRFAAAHALRMFPTFVWQAELEPAIHRRLNRTIAAKLDEIRRPAPAHDRAPPHSSGIFFPWRKRPDLAGRRSHCRGDIVVIEFDRYTKDLMLPDLDQDSHDRRFAERLARFQPMEAFDEDEALAVATHHDRG